jgi:hypothetical protein
MPYFESNAGVIVKVGVTVNGLEHINYLPVMNFRNESIKKENVNMMDINKAIQRCTVKAIALHGLGLYIYAGEDLPETPLIKPALSDEKFKKALTFTDAQKKDVRNQFDLTIEQLNKLK